MSAFRSNAAGADGSLMHPEFMAFAIDEASVAALRSFAERQGFPAATVQMGGPDMFTQMLEQGSPPKLAIVDIDGQENPAAAASRLSSLCGADCKLVALGSANDVSLYRRMLSAGMIDYIVKPLNSEMLGQVYATALRGGAAKGEAKEAKIVVMIGVRGGTGTSTIAVNTGWLLAHELKFQCALLDLDLQFGTSALALDLEPGRGLRDVVTSPQRVDSLMVASSIVAASEQFSVLSAEEAIDETVLVDGTAITALMREMKGNFDFIIVDLPRQMLATQKRLLAAAHEIILVTELSLAGIRDTLRIKNALQTTGTTAGLMLVASRVSAVNPGQVDQTAFEKGAQIKIDFTIPDDPKAVALAANTGKALGAAAPTATVTKALMGFAKKLCGHGSEEAPAAKKGFWEKLTGDSPKADKNKKEIRGSRKPAKDKP